MAQYQVQTISKLTYYNGKRKYGGGAATMHFLKLNGGIDNVVNEVARQAVQCAISQMTTHK